MHQKRVTDPRGLYVLRDLRDKERDLTELAGGASSHRFGIRTNDAETA